MEKVEKIISLINKHREKTLTQVEKNELASWLAESEENRSLFAELTDQTILAHKLRVYGQADSKAIWEKTLQQIDPAGKVVPLQPVQRAWWKYTAAAAVVGALAVAGWLYFKPVPSQEVAEQQPAGTPTEEVLPGSSKAILTLSNGRKVVLDHAADQQSIQQGIITISKAGGRLTYPASNEAGAHGPADNGSAVLYNTVTTPNGGEYQVTLPDGSIVWLNAASSLRFPIAFAGGERNVSLTGEAFFQVAPMAGKPFKVAIESPLGDGGTVEVLGTQFNINAYTDDALVKTTLLEGSVKLTTKTSVQQMLKPGQEALVNKSGQVQNVRTVDIATAVPWRNGYFNLQGDVKAVLQEIGRWYNLKVEFAGKIPSKSLKGQISRTYPITDVLEILRTQGIATTLNKKDKKLVII